MASPPQWRNRRLPSSALAWAGGEGGGRQGHPASIAGEGERAEAGLRRVASLQKSELPKEEVNSNGDRDVPTTSPFHCTSSVPGSSLRDF